MELDLDIVDLLGRQCSTWDTGVPCRKTLSCNQPDGVSEIMFKGNICHRGGPKSVNITSNDVEMDCLHV